MLYLPILSSPAFVWRQSLIAVMVGLLLSGCATQLTYGSAPDTAALNSLVRGQTTEAEIRQIVGPPRGRGEARLSADMARRDILFYEFVHAEGQRIDLKMLLIFLKDSRYDGYLWFSAADAPRLAER